MDIRSPAAVRTLARWFGRIDSSLRARRSEIWIFPVSTKKKLTNGVSRLATACRPAECRTLVSQADWSGCPLYMNGRTSSAPETRDHLQFGSRACKSPRIASFAVAWKPVTLPFSGHRTTPPRIAREPRKSSTLMPGETRFRSNTDRSDEASGQPQSTTATDAMAAPKPTKRGARRLRDILFCLH